jgi:group I intron endonuclease
LGAGTPLIVYDNPDLQKEDILKENKGKSGVYRWVNKVTGKTYVGSSVDLSIRFKNYHNYTYISDPAKNMAIYRALLKYGYSNFKLEIIEYCEPTNAVKREQFYFDLLQPEYNILTTAGSSLGFQHSEVTLAKFRARKHSEETKQKMSEARIGYKHIEETLDKFRARKHSEETLAKMRARKHSEETLAKFRAQRNTEEYKRKMSEAQIGRKHSEETRKKISDVMSGENNPMFPSGEKILPMKLGRRSQMLNWAKQELKDPGRPSQQILVIDKKTNLTTTYESISAAARALGIGKSTISKYIARNLQEPFKGQYIFQKL